MQLTPTEKLKIPSGKDLKITILLPYFNEEIGLELYQNTVSTLEENEVKKENIKLVRVPGALELPFAAQKEIKSAKPDVVIALGVVIKGETSHYDYVCSETFRGLMDVQLKLETPIIFGILTCKNKKQAQKRASKNGLNKGKSFALAALIQT
ncbi:MAG: 6,7-dimethyl-8-ribityllumazine synthase [Candidatus Gracilibacteria bacterium]